MSVCYYCEKSECNERYGYDFCPVENCNIHGCDGCEYCESDYEEDFIIIETEFIIDLKKDIYEYDGLLEK